MKLATFAPPGAGPRAGWFRDGSYYDLARAVADFRPRLSPAPDLDFSSLLAVLAGGRPGLDAARRVEELVAEKPSGEKPEWSYPAAEVTVLAPLPRPNSIRDFLLFDEHLENAMHTQAKLMFPPAAWVNSAVKKTFGRPLIRPPRSWRKLPAYYKGNPDTVIGPGHPIEWPSYTEKLDYELEFGFYILGTGRDIAERDAPGFIAGYTIFNDMSARDVQMEEMAGRLGPAKGKDFDTGNVMGPWLVTPDEVGDPYGLALEAWVNGERWSAGTSAGMRFSFAEIISYVARSETLWPGDFFGSGTVGTGCGLELDRWLRPEDVVTLKVDRLGELANRIVRG